MCRLPMAISPAAGLSLGLLFSGALGLDEDKEFGFGFIHPATWNMKAGQVGKVTDSLGIWISR
ncbi:hypothetical protein KBA41_16675 [Candidatus Ozemobacteraceae bacterium]|nr:hypothetical protein [Candidatus Ozemobacteraceae bacterium]